MHRTEVLVNLNPQLTIPRAVALAICTLIGSGLLGLPGLAIESAGPVGALFAWPIGILVSLPLMLIFMALANTVKDAGGVAKYAELALGPWAATSTSLILILTFAICIPLGTYMGCAYLSILFGATAGMNAPLTAFTLIAATLISAWGIKPTARIHTGAVSAILFLIVSILWEHPGLFTKGLDAYLEAPGLISQLKWQDLWRGGALIFWAFLGWENLSFSSEETAAGQRTNTAIYSISFTIISLIYAALAIVTTGAHRAGLDVSGVTGLLVLMKDSSMILLIKPLMVLIVLANVSAWVHAASRLAYSAGRELILPAWVGKLSNNQIPQNSLFALLALYLIVVLCLSQNWLTLTLGLSLANQNFIVIYSASILCYARYQRRPHQRVLAAIGMLSCGFLVAGFGGWMAIPIGLGLFGALIHRLRHRLP